MTDETRVTCGDCGVPEGQLHKLGCDMERCPFCGHQLISCDCIYEKLGLFDPARYDESTAYLPPEIYHNGPTEEQEREYEQMLNKKGRFPYIHYPVLCAMCGVPYPGFFRVPDDEWRHYVRPDKWREVICWPCYVRIKSVVDQGKQASYPAICARCGALNPQVPQVADEEWQRYIQPDVRNEVVCQACYNHIKQVIDENQ